MPDVQANGLSLHYQSLGREDDPAIVLVMGLAMQMIVWPDPLCDMLVARGFRVIRFDNRDVGLSSHLDHLGVPSIPLAYLKFMARLAVRAPYAIDDMARDTAGLIDALGLQRPHVVGASMGGMIAQNLAAQFPEKVASLTSIMSTTGRRSLPQPSWKTRRALLRPPAKPGDVEGAVERMMGVLRVIASRTYPAEAALMRELCERHVRRSNHPAGAARQLLAIAASGDRTAIVRRIKAPALVIHGDEDPLVPSACGEETARVIRNGGGDARLSVIAGMGHDFPVPLLSKIAEEIITHCRNAMDSFAVSSPAAALD